MNLYAAMFPSLKKYWKGFVVLCLSGPALEVLPVPDLDLAQGLAPGEWGDMRSLASEGVCEGQQAPYQFYTEIQNLTWSEIK